MKWFSSKSDERAQKRHILDSRDADAKQDILTQNAQGPKPPQATPKEAKEIGPKETKDASKRYGRIF
jgi:hypothetical protein